MRDALSRHSLNVPACSRRRAVARAARHRPSSGSPFSATACPCRLVDPVPPREMRARRRATTRSSTRPSTTRFQRRGSRTRSLGGRQRRRTCTRRPTGCAGTAECPPTGDAWRRWHLSGRIRLSCECVTISLYAGSVTKKKRLLRGARSLASKRTKNATKTPTTFFVTVYGP
jgi:hypothetical protein